MGFVHKHYNEITLIIGFLSLIFSIFTFIMSSSIKKQVRKSSFRGNVKNDIEHLNRYCEILCCSPDRLTDLPFLTDTQNANIATGEPRYLLALYYETLSKAKAELSYLGSKYKKTLDKKTKDKIQHAANVIYNALNFCSDEDCDRGHLVRCANLIKEIVGDLERLREE